MSTLNVDALVGNTSANAITVRGEGTATTSLQQGLSKHWVNLDGTGTFAISDSFNCASVTDDGTGDYDPFFTNNMSNTEYSVACGCPSGAGDHSVINASTLATNKYRVVVSDGGASLEDQDPAMTQINGDLA